MKWAKRLGLPIKSTQTPYEQADMIAKVVPDGRQSIQDITHAYVESQYSLRKGTKFTEQLQQVWNLLFPLFHQKKRNK